MPEDWITFEKFTEDVNAIEFYSNGELSSADALVIPVVAHIDLISMNVCQP